jgi:hypothetical protein
MAEALKKNRVLYTYITLQVEEAWKYFCYSYLNDLKKDFSVHW